MNSKWLLSSKSHIKLNNAEYALFALHIAESLSKG